MTIFSKDQLELLVRDIATHAPSQVILLIGDRFLCQRAAERISTALLADGGSAHLIDGDQENFPTTLNKLRSFSLLPGRQIYRVSDTKLFHSKKVAPSIWKRAVQAHDNNDRKRAAGYLRTFLESAGLNASDRENDPAELSAAQWKKFFGFNRPADDISWTGELLVTSIDQDQRSVPPPADDPAVLLQKVLDSGIPENNVLLLLAEDVDKRKRLYKLIKDKQVVVDLSVESGSSSRARNAQESVLLELMNTTLSGFGKTMAAGVAKQLFERVGFHPVAVVMETEKLALYVGKNPKISIADLNAVVGRTRQEALFELTDALGKNNFDRALFVTARLLENNVHPLAVTATLRNFARNLFLLRALQERDEYGYSRSMSPAVFQQHCLPRLKKNDRWKEKLSGHPYAVYMQFKTASSFSPAVLKNWLCLLLRAEMRLKSSPISPDIIIHHLIFSMMSK